MAANLVDPKLAKAALLEESFGAEEPLSEDERFIDEVCEWLKRWIDNIPEADRKLLKPFGFLFLEGRGPDEVLPESEFAPSFRSSASQEVSGKLHACSLGLRNVFRQEFGFKDSAAALSWLAANSEPTCTVVIFVPSEDLALIKQPLVSFDDCETLPFKSRSEAPPFEFSMVDSLLDQFHEEWTSTHQAYCQIWKKAGKRVLKDFAEKQIQMNLLGFLNFYVRADGKTLAGVEFQTRRGRTDISLVKLSAKQAVEMCVLELKVLREQAAEDVRDWALSGVTQLIGYRKSVGYPGPDYLCCYDARSVDQDISEVLDACNAAEIGHKRFYMSTE